MKYQELQQMEKVLKMQLDMLTIMEEFIKFDEEYQTENPQEILPPIMHPGVLRSHFITQRKACEGFLSYTARHLPRMKIEYDLANKNKIVTTKKEPVSISTHKTEKVIDNKNKKICIENPQVNDSTFISLF